MASRKDLNPRSAKSARFEGRTEEGAPADKRVCLAVVGAPHGVRGAVRIKSFTAAPEAVAAYGPLQDESGRRQFALKVVGAGKGDGVVIAEIAGIIDRDQAEALRGCRLYAPRAALPPADEDEFYHADLIGLAAELGDGGPLGRVVAVHDFGAGDVLEIARDHGPPLVVPFTRAVVPVVDLVARRLVLDPPDGLLVAPPAERAEAAA